MKSALKEAKHTCGSLLYTRWTSCTYSNSTSRWRTSTPNTEHLLALSVFQVKVWVEVDQNPLVRSWSCNHPYAFLRWVVRHRITGWSEVICATDFDIVPTFVWKNRKEKKNHSYWKYIAGHQHSTPYVVFWMLRTKLFN